MPDWLWWLLIPTASYALHRLASWMETRGWLYWSKSGGHTTRAGSAMLEIQQLMEPSNLNPAVDVACNHSLTVVALKLRVDSTKVTEPPLLSRDRQGAVRITNFGWSFQLRRISPNG